jgi:DNA replication protein DnaC
MEIAGFYPRYTTGEWEYMPEQMYRKVQEILLEEFCGNIHKEPRGFFINGVVGVGKSMLMGLCARYIMRQFAANVRFYSAGMLEEVFFDKISSPRKKEEINLVKSCDVLFLDDLGTEYGSAFSMSGFTSIIEHRYANFKPTFFTSNYAVEELAMIDGYERIASRLNQRDWVYHLRYNGSDKRQRPAKTEE